MTDIARNLHDLIEEIDAEYPRMLLAKIPSVYAWRILVADGGRTIGLMSVKFMADGCCAEIIIGDSGGVVSFPERKIIMDVTRLSDAQERAKLTDVLTAVRDEVFG